MRVVSLVILLVPLAFATSCATLRVPSDALVFSVVGHGPRHDQEWSNLREQVNIENRDGGSQFIVHLGNIWQETEELPEDNYAQVADILMGSSMPVYILPGANEWTKLENPKDGWTHWQNHLLAIDEHWSDTPPVARQAGRESNFAFVQEGVLFIGLTLPADDRTGPEQEARTKDNIAWIHEQFGAQGGSSRAAVIFANGQPRPDHTELSEALEAMAERFDNPVVFMHNGGFTWTRDRRWLAGNMARIQVQPLGEAPPLRVVVTRSSWRTFRFDHQLRHREYRDDYETLYKRDHRYRRHHHHHGIGGHHGFGGHRGGYGRGGGWD